MNSAAYSYLFVPASRPERIAKAIDSGAEAVIVDLEDAVAPIDKAAALQTLQATWPNYALHAWAKRVTLLLRINVVDTEWHAAELAACRILKINQIIVPKAADAAVLANIAVCVPGVHLYPLIESAEGFDRLADVAKVPGVVRLLFGSIDLMLDLGISDPDLPLHYYRTRIVLESRLAGLEAPVDGVCVELNNVEILKAEVQRALAFGFGAKLLIHPKQVEITQKGFAPSAEELDWARKIVDTAASANGAAVAVDGKMVDRPVLLRAEKILSPAE